MKNSDLRPFPVIEKPAEGEYPSSSRIYIDPVPNDG